MKILISDYRVKNDYSYEKKLLAKYYPDSCLEVYRYLGDKKELLEKMKASDALLTCFLPVDRELMEQSPKLKIISVDAVGYGNIDIAAAKEHFVSVCTLGEYCTEEVADHTLALILMLEKNMKRLIRLADREQVYSFASTPRLHRLSTQTLAIFGYGRIGRSVAKRALAFGFRVLAVTRHPERLGTRADGVEFVSGEEALRQADVISNHMNHTPENKNYFNLHTFKQMKKDAFFINVSRGASVEERDLLYALDHQLLAGAGLDVLKENDPDLTQNPFAGRDDVILTPHSAFYSVESMAYLKDIPVMNIIHFFASEPEKISCTIC